jgi:polysaccharide biosynthesis/export protein
MPRSDGSHPFGRLRSFAALRMTVGLLAVFIPLTGCASKKQATETEKINQWLSQHGGDSQPADYKVNPPDVIQVSAPGISELNEQRVTVRPDGYVSLSLLGDVYVADKTPGEIAEELRKAALKYYDRNIADGLAVQVVEFKSKVVYVFGQVRQPGIKPFGGNDTVLHVLAEAQLGEDAWAEKVVIVRPNEDVNVKQRVTVDLKQMYASGQASQNYVLEEGDVIYVPPTPLARVNATFTKLLAPIRPTLGLLSLGMRGGI